MGRNVCPQFAAASPAGQRCGDCLAHRRSFDSAVAAFHYAFPVDQGIGRLKYGSRLALAPWLGHSLAEAVRQSGQEDVDFILPLLLSRERLAERGFNQSGLLAAELSQALGLTLQRKVLQRIRHTPAQAALDRKARVRNVRGAFSCTADLQGSRIAIIDDVMTTGATVDAAARTLKKAGAAEVKVWVVARADRTHLPSSADTAFADSTVNNEDP
jgi:ComF family protein